MLFWSLALAVSAIAGAALYYAGAGRRLIAAPDAADSPEMAHLRLQLKEIDADAALGRLGPAEATSAKAELAREVIRLKGSGPAAAVTVKPGRRMLVGAAVGATLLLTFGVYTAIGRPDLPAEPLATRTDLPTQLTLEDAIARIEAQLKTTPDDVRGWSVIAPAYMQLGRYDDAAAALRRVIALDGATADRETDLGEALMMANDGKAAGEPMSLFASAAARDPSHVRSRYYMASEATQQGDFDSAKVQWTALLALAKGDEPWVAAAQSGLATAEGKGVAPAAPIDNAAIKGMVEGLSTRLLAEGGTIDDWTRLVRSRLVLNQKPEAQAAYDAARAAYPDAATRSELDVLAADNGLVASK